jgi:hypothetical protein
MLLGALGKVHALDRSRVGMLIGLGLLSTLLYGLGVAARYPLAPGLQHPRAGWSTLAEHSLRVGLAHAGVYGLLIVGYMLALRLALRLEGRCARTATAIVVAGWLLSSAALLGAYPGESLDIFDYVFRGRMLVENGASPLATAPSIFKDQPFYIYITWRGQVDTYGPLWEYASGIVAWAVHYLLGRADSQIAYIVGYRLMAVALAGVCGVLVVAIVRRSGAPYASAALLAWLWNPLLITTTAIGAHNDILMLLAVLAALLLFQRRRWVWGLLALALAAHVKLTALLILPIFGLWLLRRCGWLRTARICALALALGIPMSWMLYAPLGGWATLRHMLQERARLLINSPADLVYRLLQERYSWAEPDAWRATTVAATFLFFAAAALIAIWFWWQTRERAVAANRGAAAPLDAPLWRASLAITLVYLLIGSFWFQHWYLLWALAPAVLLPASRWTLTLLPAYCLGALWSDLANSFLRGLPTQPYTATQLDAFNVLVQVAPLLCVIILSGLWQRMPRLFAQVRRHGVMLRAKPALAPPGYEMDDLS